MIAEWTDEPRPWGEMTDAEKGALLLAKHEGKEIQMKYPRDVNWLTDPYVKFNSPDLCYRVKPEPVVETVTVYGLSDPGVWTFGAVNMGDTHRITFDVIDGAPDVSSVKMERIDD